MLASWARVARRHASVPGHSCAARRHRRRGATWAFPWRDQKRPQSLIPADRVNLATIFEASSWHRWGNARPDCSLPRCGVADLRPVGLEELPLPWTCPTIRSPERYWHARAHHDPGVVWPRNLVFELFPTASRTPAAVADRCRHERRALPASGNLGEALRAPGASGNWQVLAGGTDLYARAPRAPIEGPFPRHHADRGVEGHPDDGSGMAHRRCTTWRAAGHATAAGVRGPEGRGEIGGGDQNAGTVAKPVQCVPRGWRAALPRAGGEVELVSARGAACLPLADFVLGSRRRRAGGRRIASRLLLVKPGPDECAQCVSQTGPSALPR